MSLQSRIGVYVLSLAISPVVLAQGATATSTESTAVTHQVKSGVVESVAGNKIVVKEADGVHEYNLPDGFVFQMNGQSVGVDQLKPGMKVDAVITDKVTTRNVKVSRVASATVMQVAPGGIVVKTASGDLKSYDFRTPGERHLLRPGRQGDPAPQREEGRQAERHPRHHASADAEQAAFGGRKGDASGRARARPGGRCGARPHAKDREPAAASGIARPRVRRHRALAPGSARAPLARSPQWRRSPT